jgi:hypothetical protein
MVAWHKAEDFSDINTTHGALTIWWLEAKWLMWQLWWWISDGDCVMGTDRLLSLHRSSSVWLKVHSQAHYKCFSFIHSFISHSIDLNSLNITFQNHSIPYSPINMNSMCVTSTKCYPLRHIYIYIYIYISR